MFGIDRVSRRALLGAAAAIGLLWAAPGAADAATVKLGVLAPLTGPASGDGEDYVHGVTMAVEEANAKGGMAGSKFEVMAVDVKDGSATAVTSAVERLLADKDVQVILTGYASISNFEINLMADADMPFLIAGPSGQTRAIIAPDPAKYWCCWSYTASFDGYETEVTPFIEGLAKAGKIKLADKKKVAIVSSDNAYSKTISEGMKKVFAKAGWTITVDELVPFGEVTDWRVILAKVRQDPPDVVINTDYLPGNSATFMNQFMEAPTNSLVFLQYAPSVPEFVKLAGNNATGVLYNLLGGPIRSPNYPLAGERLAQYKARWGAEGGPYGVMLYEMAWHYFKALEQVKDPSKHEAIGKAIGAMTLDSAQGKMAFDQKTHLALQDDAHVPLQFYQLWNGDRVLLSPAQYATGEFRLPPWMKN